MSKVVRDLVESFNRATERCRAKSEIIAEPFTLKTWTVKEPDDADCPAGCKPAKQKA